MKSPKIIDQWSIPQFNGEEVVRINGEYYVFPLYSKDGVLTRYKDSIGKFSSLECARDRYPYVRSSRKKQQAKGKKT